VALPLLAACSSSPVSYLTLDPVPAAQQLAAPAPGGVLRVGAVSLPEILDRAALVRSAGPGHLDIDDNERWAAPLDEVTRRTLTGDLGSRLAGWTVLDARDVTPGGAAIQRLLLVDADSFAENPSGQVELNVRWTLLEGTPPAPVLQRSETISVPVAGASATAVAQAMSGAVGILADRIAAALPGPGRLTAP
jgi:uncharacterized lipoprotein YmbA